MNSVSKLIRNNIFIFFLLAMIFAVGLALRLFHLDSAPRGALIDEAHFGFIAKSLLLTGKDEHGMSWPLVFKGFGDQKMPTYAYLLIPFIAVMDLSVISIRLPSVIAGSLAAIAMYFLARQMKFNSWWSLVAALIMATSPWSFFMSRFGFESNVAVLLWILALTGLVWIFDKKNAELETWKGKGVAVVTGLLMASTWYTYIAYRPITAVVLALVTLWSMLVASERKNLKSLGIVTAIMIVAVLPLFHPSVRAANSARLQQVGIFSNTDAMARQVNEYRTFCNMSLPLSVCSAIWNKGTLIVQTLTQRYLEVFSPEFLVTRGELNETLFVVKDFGQFSLILYPFLLIGLGVLFFQYKKLSTERILLISALLLSPIPTIIAGNPQKVRMSALLPLMVLAIVYGLAQSFEWAAQLPKFRKFSLRPVLVFAVGVIFAATTALYYADFFTVHTLKNDYMYQSYVRDLFTEVHAKFPQHKIMIKSFFPEPLMFYAFYTNMSPSEYQRQAKLGLTEASGFQHTIKLDQIEIWGGGMISAVCQAYIAKEPTLYLTNEKETGVIVAEGKTSDKVFTYLYAYDALATAKLRITECVDVPIEERLRIEKENLKL